MPLRLQSLTNTNTASGWYYKDESYTCPNKGVLPGGKCDQSQLCTNPQLDKGTPSAVPCCNRCDQLSGVNSKSWFWECVVPSSGSYTFSLLAGQTTYVGACTVTAAPNRLSIGNCHIVDGWYATDVSIYMSYQKSTSCAPGIFGKQGQLKSFAPTTGDLTSVGVGGSYTTTTAYPSRYVMVHFSVGQ